MSFEANEETLGLLGASGSGKSMTLKCIAGIETPDRGQIILNGRTLFDSEKGICLPTRLRKTGFLFQQYALFPNMTVSQNIAAGIRKLPKEMQGEQIGQYISLLQLKGLERRFPHELSGGQQQRVALARMLCCEPEILMLDEPFSALDQHLKEITLPKLATILEKFGKTVLYVSHNMDEAYMLCPRIAVMSDGAVDSLLQRKEIFQNPRTIATAKLAGAKNIVSIRREDAHLLHVPDWDCTLSCHREILSEHSHASIHAHFLQIVEMPGENTLRCTVEQILTARFERTILLQTSGGETLFMQADKGLLLQELTVGQTVFIKIPPHKITLLQESARSG